MERSECREVLLVEWGAPAGDTNRARADFCLEAPWEKAKLPRACCHTPRTAPHQHGLSLAPLSQRLLMHHPKGAGRRVQDTPLPRGTPGLVGCSAAPWDHSWGFWHTASPQLEYTVMILTTASGTRQTQTHPTVSTPTFISHLSLSLAGNPSMLGALGESVKSHGSSFSH